MIDTIFIFMAFLLIQVHPDFSKYYNSLLWRFYGDNTMEGLHINRIDRIGCCKFNLHETVLLLQYLQQPLEIFYTC